MTDLIAQQTAPGAWTRLVRRAPLISFFVLSCLLSWWVGVLYLVGASPVPIAGFGPFLAAVIVLAMTEGRAGLGRMFRAMVRWRVPVRAYVAAVGLPVLVSGLAILGTIVSGGHPDPVALTLWTDIPGTMLLILLIPGLGGAWEEPGFRGYALARLEHRFGALTGPLVLGVLWVAWHLPLFLAGQILVTDVLTIIAASVVIAAVFHSGRNSILIAMLLHATNNAVGGGYASQLFHGSENLRLGILTAALWWVVAVVVMVRRWRSTTVDVFRPTPATAA